MVPAFFVSRIDANKRNEERHRAGQSTSGASGYVRDDTVLSYDVTKGGDAVGHGSSWISREPPSELQEMVFAHVSL